jgi:hypothetical protein
MQTQTVKLIDPSGKVVATAQVADEGAFYGGTIDLRETPPNLRALFEAFEEIVNGQMFALLDDIQERIGALSLKAVFDSGQEAYVKDLQVFPSTGDVSFKLAEVSAHSGRAV